LKELSWTYGHFSDSGLEELSKAKSLEILNLKSSFNMTPKSLEILGKMQGLKSLNLIEVDGITREDINDLQKRLPNTEILWWNNVVPVGRQR